MQRAALIGRWLLPLTFLCLGCHGGRVDTLSAVEANLLPLVPPGASVTVGPRDAGPAAPVLQRVDLPALWDLALVHNPALREASAELEAARGRQVQAGLYPNPRLLYDQDTVGSRLAPQGNFTAVASQEVVTAGKLRLDRAVAERGTASAAWDLVGRKYEVLTRIRRVWYDYLSLRGLLRLNADTVASLERGLTITRQQVESSGTRPRTDVLRLEALLEEARINQARVQEAAAGAWKELAAEVGVRAWPEPADGALPEEAVPAWDEGRVLPLVLGRNTTLQQVAVAVERAALAMERARAEVVPNVAVGLGYNADNTDQTAGGLVTVETSLPVWNRQQGAIREAEARLAGARAAVRGAELRLTRDTAEAEARYRAARVQVERLESEVLPRLRQSLELLLKAYQAGSAQVSFSDVLMTEQSLNSSRLMLGEARRSLWQAVADLEGLMQLEIGEEHAPPPLAACGPAG